MIELPTVLYTTQRLAAASRPRPRQRAPSHRLEQRRSSEQESARLTTGSHRPRPFREIRHAEKILYSGPTKRAAPAQDIGHFCRSFTGRTPGRISPHPPGSPSPTQTAPGPHILEAPRPRGTLLQLLALLRAQLGALRHKTQGPNVSSTSLNWLQTPYNIYCICFKGFAH